MRREIYSQLASAAIDRLGDPPDQREAFLLNEGWRKRVFGLGDGAAEFKRSLELARQAYGPKDPQLVSSMVAVCVNVKGEPARACHQEILDVAAATLGPQHPMVAAIYNNMAGELIKHERTRPEACDLFRKAIAIYEHSTDGGHHDYLSTKADLAKCLRDMGQMDEAKKIYEDVLAKAVRPSMDRAHIRQSYAIFLSRQGDFKGSAHYTKLALDERRGIHGACHDSVIETVTNLTVDLLELHRPEEAFREMSDTLSACERSGARPSKMPTLYNQLGFALQTGLKRHREALEMHRKALAFQEQEKATEREKHYSFHGIGIAELGLGRMKEAAAALARALDLRLQEGFDPDQRGDTELALAQALSGTRGTRARQHAKACALANKAVDHFQEAGPLYATQKRTATKWVARYCATARS